MTHVKTIADTGFHHFAVIFAKLCFAVESRGNGIMSHNFVRERQIFALILCHNEEEKLTQHQSHLNKLLSLNSRSILSWAEICYILLQSCQELDIESKYLI